MERTEYLDRLRRRLASPKVEPLPHRHAPSPGIPEAGWPQALDDTAGVFMDTARRKGAIVRRAASGDAGSVLEELIELEPVRSAILSADPETRSTAGVLAAAGVEILPWDGTGTAARADLGVTGAAFGIAATGSIVVDAGRAGGRTASLLPPIHLAILRADRLLRTPADLWRHMPDRFPDGPPSQAVVITGPSKTGDIEMTLTTGVHGPGRLWICLLG